MAANVPLYPYCESCSRDVSRGAEFCRWCGRTDPVTLPDGERSDWVAVPILVSFGLWALLVPLVALAAVAKLFFGVAPFEYGAVQVALTGATVVAVACLVAFVGCCLADH